MKEKVLIIQADYDAPVKFQKGLLLKQSPIREAIDTGKAKVLTSFFLTRKAVLNELRKPYEFVYVGSHGNDLQIRGFNRQVILKKSDADLFRGKRVYAYVCNSFESGIFNKAIESITYKDKFVFPAPDGNPVFKSDIDVWALLQLGFYPVNRAVEAINEGQIPNLRQIFLELPEQFRRAAKFLSTNEARESLLNNLRAIRYRKGLEVLKLRL